MQQNNTDRFQTTITVYSFILTVLVIWIHAVDPVRLTQTDAAVSMDLARSVQELLGTGLGQIAVPGFFCMSGYLFFRNCKKADKAFFFGKWKSRLKTLVLPYLLWNLIYYLIYILAGRAPLRADILMDALIFYRFNPVFWYLLELIMITAVTPLIYLILKSKNAAVPVLVLSYLSAVYYSKLPVHFINEDALFYYMSGAALALHYRNKEDDPTAMKRLFAVMSVLILIFADVCMQKAAATIMYGIVGVRIAGVLAVFALISIVQERTMLKVREFMCCNFLVYALHYMELRLFRMAVKTVFGNNVLVECVLYVMMPVLCIGVSMFAARIMKRFIPKVYAVLTGGRVA